MPWEGQFMSIISETTKSYISGFLDGDGCIMFQLIKRHDYKYGFQIRASIVFYQKTQHIKHLEWLQSVLRFGYIRKRKDDMTEYTIVGIEPVIKVLKLLKPYIKIKSEHVKCAFLIDRLLKGKFNLVKFIKAAELVDEFKRLNYSKKRINESIHLKEYIRQHKLYPRND